MRGPTPSIGPIPTLPVYFKLAGRDAILAGGSLPAVWKLELLAAAGAKVRVRDPAPCPELLELAASLGSAVELLARAWNAEDFDHCALAVGVLAGQEALGFRDAARGAGVPVNIVDMPDLCDFQFGTIVARSPLLIGISTDGAAPVFGQALRARIEALLPHEIQAWAQAAKDWRIDLQKRKLGFAARRRFWETFSGLALDGSGRRPSETDRDACLRAALQAESAAPGGLTLVGIGPGDPDLMTLRALRTLQSVETVIYDPGVPPGALSLGRREARRLLAPDLKTAAGIIRGEFAAGRAMAWAGLGDPDTCGAWRERRDWLTQSRIEFDVVNGLPRPSSVSGLHPVE